MSQKKRKILVVSRNPTLAQIRKTVCEGAGFTVLAATNDSAVEPACIKGIEFILVGYSVAPSDKRRVWAKSRQYSDVPIMELQRSGSPELIERNVFAKESKRAHDCLIVVQKLPLGEAKMEPASRPKSKRPDAHATSSRSTTGRARMAERKVLHEHEAQKEQAKTMRTTARKMRNSVKKMRRK